uniref:Uncharacterized protein n=1 Tax=viral metagenome TaxID=1070528 RepID=A0A6M3L966_9ZZZZ
MAQTQTWTNTGITELVQLLYAGTGATKLMSIVGLTDTTACTAAVTSTYASPADAKCTDTGLEIANITTIAVATANTAGDSVDFDHVFTASGTKNVSGIIVCNDDDDVAFIECCFNAVLAMENTDTLTIDGRATIDQA